MNSDWVMESVIGLLVSVTGLWKTMSGLWVVVCVGLGFGGSLGGRIRSV